jgi:type II secretory pathway component PulF
MAIAITGKKTPARTQGRDVQSAKRPKASVPGRLFRKKIPAREILFFTNQLSLMLEIGTPLNQSLSAISSQIRNPEFKTVVTAVLAAVEDGSMLSDALQQYPALFSPEYTSLVSAGENTGHLHEMLDRIVELQEKREAFASALKGAMTYPLVLCAVSTLVIIFMLSFVFPRFAILFRGVEEILPPTTKFLMGLSDFLRAYWYGVLVFFGVVGWGLHRYLKTEQGRFTIDRLKITLPLLSGITVRIYLSQLMRTLGFLIGSNVPLMEALRITKRGTTNVLFSRFMDCVSENVEGGQGISAAFTEAPFIPETVSQMVATGEASQKLDRVMLRLSDYYEGEIEAQVKRLTTIIEPALLIIMGIVVGLIVVSLVLPIFKLSKVVH